MSKNSDRARVEKNLEDMMGNDWRMFRARLVAQEHLEHEEEKSSNEQKEKKKKKDVSTAHFVKSPSSASSSSSVEEGGTSTSSTTSSGSPSSSLSSSAASATSDEKMDKQESIGSMFAKIFNNNKQSADTDYSSSPGTQGGKSGKSASKNGREPTSSIFDGDNIAGASAMIPDACEDPFVSISEIPVLLESKVKIDKHRWAHEIPHIEPGCILIANEQLGGIFHQTVLLVIEHNDANGSNGIVINRPLNGDLLKIASEKESSIDLSLKLAFGAASVGFGGPNKPEDYNILHGYGEVEGAKKVAPGVFVGGSAELMKEVRKHNLNPKEALFTMGNVVWEPEQLSREVSKGVWYIASCSSDFILRYAGAPTCEEDNTNDLWADILSCMGKKYQKIAAKNAGKGDKRLNEKKP